MDQTGKLKAAFKAEIRKTIKEVQESSNSLKIAKNKALKHIELVSKNTQDWGLIDDINNIKQKIKNSDSEELITQLVNWVDGKSDIPLNKINELARVANTLKIGNLKAAQAYAEANKGKWVSDLVLAVIKAGSDGITQPALAVAIGKGSQQTINPKVRELLAAGVLTQGEAGIKTATPKQEPKAKETPKLATSTSKDEDDDEDIEFTDDFEKSDAEDDAPEDEDTMAAKATPNKGVQTDAKKLDQVLADMKKLAADYKTKKGTPDGDAIVAKLKDLNKEKVKLEKTVHKALGDEDDDLLDTTGDD